MTTHAGPFDAMSVRSTSWVRERDVDLLLAESLSTLPGFVQWFVGRVPVMAAHAESVERCNAVVNFNRPDARGDATGETDVLAHVHLVQRVQEIQHAG